VPTGAAPSRAQQLEPRTVGAACHHHPRCRRRL